MKDQALSLARKIKALADKGVDGERSSAEAMLLKLLKKHGLSIDDVESPDIAKRELKYSEGAAKTLAMQIIANVAGRGVSIWTSTRKRNVYIVECTQAQVLEMQAKLDFYWAIYKQEQKIFYNAFVQMNDLGVSVEGERAPMTDAQRKEIEEMLRMMQGMKSHQFHKRIGTEPKERI